MAVLKPSGVVAIALAMLAPGCAGYHRLCPTLVHFPDALVPGDVEVTFLGVGGFLIRYDDVVIMTAPLYSNPTMGEIATQPARSDFRLIESLLPRDADEAVAILVGHSHYDHLMDVPYVATRRARHAEIIGNDAMVKLLAPWTELRNRVCSVESKARCLEDLRCAKTCPDPDGYAKKVGDRIRVWPIVSEHSSQFKIPMLDEKWFPAVHLWRGDLFFPLKEPPLTAGEWVEGTTLAYLIDMYDKTGGLAFRVYYQDSGARQPFGFPPPCLLEGHRVDLALLCTGGSSTLRNHPAEIVSALEPRFAMAAHWEDFFNPRKLPLPEPCSRTGPSGPSCSGSGERPSRCERFNEVHGANVKSFVRHLRSTLPADGQYVVPCPDSVTRFARAGDGWRIRDRTEPWADGKGPLPHSGARSVTTVR